MHVILSVPDHLINFAYTMYYKCGFYRPNKNRHLSDHWNFFFKNIYSTVQAFFHQPAHPRGEGATI